MAETYVFFILLYQIGLNVSLPLYKNHGLELTAKEFELLLCEFCWQDLPPHFVVEHNTRNVGGESLNKRQIDTKISGSSGYLKFLFAERLNIGMKK